MFPQMTAEEMESELRSLLKKAAEAQPVIEEQHAKVAARIPQGLYGFRKATQKDCEAAVRKLNRVAARLAKAAWKKDAKVVDFLVAHSKKGKDHSARILVGALKEIGPKVGSEDTTADKLVTTKSSGKVAAGSHSLYGFRTKTVQVGLGICASVKEAAGHIASDLHRRRYEEYENITGFLTNHAKTARCPASRLILVGYPESSIKIASKEPKSVTEWLAWEEPNA